MVELNCDQSSKNEETNKEEEDQNGELNTEFEKQKGRRQHEEEDAEEKVLQFLDSLDSYLVLVDSLSSTLRQGWLDLASARYSMGASRVTSALFDLKLHPAASTLRVTQRDGESLLQDSLVKQPHFSLCRWSTSSGTPCCSGGMEHDEGELQKKSNNSLLRCRGKSENCVDKEHISKASPASPRSPLAGDDQVQKERSKSLSVFGTLVSPKLREAQVSFETALETLVEIANMQSMMRSAHTQIQQMKDGCIG